MANPEGDRTVNRTASGTPAHVKGGQNKSSASFGPLGTRFTAMANSIAMSPPAIAGSRTMDRVHSAYNARIGTRRGTGSYIQQP